MSWLQLVQLVQWVQLVQLVQWLRVTGCEVRVAGYEVRPLRSSGFPNPDVKGFGFSIHTLSEIACVPRARPFRGWGCGGCKRCSCCNGKLVLRTKLYVNLASLKLIVDVAINIIRVYNLLIGRNYFLFWFPNAD